MRKSSEASRVDLGQERREVCAKGAVGANVNQLLSFRGAEAEAEAAVQREARSGFSASMRGWGIQQRSSYGAETGKCKRQSNGYTT